jgi:hypothetical protein
MSGGNIYTLTAVNALTYTSDGNGNYSITVSNPTP